MWATLTYHSIDDSGSAISVSRTAFEAHAKWLMSGRIQVLSLDDLAARGEPDDRDAVAITFDDGFLNIREAAERLLTNGLPVTIFVVSGHVGGTNAWGSRSHPGIPTLPLLGWDDLEHLVRRGATIAAHTRTHPALSTIPGSALEDELSGNCDDLRRRLGVEARHLAYPYGDFNDTVAEVAARYFSWCHTTELRVMTPSEDPRRLPRLDAYYFSRPGVLEAWGGGAFSRRLAWRRARRRLRNLLAGTHR